MMKTLKKPLSIMLSLLLLFGAATTVHASAQTTNQHKTSALFGDAHEDETVSVSDVTAIQRKVAGFSIEPFNKFTADVDKNGAVMIQDATFIQYNLADLPSPLDNGKLDGAIVADKVIGRAAAAVCVLGGVRKVHASLMSEDAGAFLKLHAVEFTADETVPQIVNREKTGRCPMELAVEGVDYPAEMVKRIRDKMKSLSLAPAPEEALKH